MSQINFLPQTIVHQSRRRRRKYRHAVLLAMLALGLAAWGFAERGQNVRPRQRAAALEAEVAAAREQMSEFVKLRDEREMLVRQNRVKDELSQPVSHTQVIAALDGHLPSSIGLTAMSITAVRPAPRPIATAGKSGSRGKAVKQEHTGPVADELQIEIDGMAPDDLTIANLIGALSEDPLFDRVTLKFSRTTEARGVEGRLFKVLMRVRLDRRFEEVARAD